MAFRMLAQIPAWIAAAFETGILPPMAGVLPSMAGKSSATISTTYVWMKRVNLWAKYAWNFTLNIMIGNLAAFPNWLVQTSRYYVKPNFITPSRHLKPIKSVAGNYLDRPIGSSNLDGPANSISRNWKTANYPVHLVICSKWRCKDVCSFCFRNKAGGVKVSNRKIHCDSNLELSVSPIWTGVYLVIKISKLFQLVNTESVSLTLVSLGLLQLLRNILSLLLWLHGSTCKSQTIRQRSTLRVGPISWF